MRPYRTSALVWLHCILACMLSASAQDNGSNLAPNGPPPLQPDPDYLFSHWETEQGLPENSATSMVQTPDGYLWFGTFGGLVRFNGDHFQVFDPSNLPQLPSKAIINLFQDSRQRLWVSTSLGLAVRDQGRWTNLATPPPWRGNYVRTFSENAGVMCMTSFDGQVATVVNGQVKELPEPPGSRGDGYLGHVDGRGRAWAAQRGYLGYFDGQQWVASPLASTVTNGWQTAGQGRDGSWLIIHTNEILRLRDGELKQRLPITPGVIDAAWGAHETDDGKIWVTSYQLGLFAVAPDGTIRRFDVTHGLRHNSSRFVMADRERNLWVGGSGGGLARFKDRTFVNIGAAEGLPTPIVKVVLEDRPGRVLIGTYGKGIFAYEGGRLSRESGESFREMGGYITGLLQDRQHQLWVTTDGGGALLRAAGRKVQNLSNAQSGGIRVAGLFEDAQGRILLGGDRTAVAFENGVSRELAGPNGIRLGGVNLFAQDPRTRVLWAAKESGLFRMGTDGWEEVRRRADRPIGDAGCLHFEPDGTLWIGATSEGILRWRAGAWSAITPEQGLPTTDVTSFLDDGAGSWWLGSKQGVLRVARDDLARVADSALKKLPAVQIFTTSDGLVSGECPSGFDSSAIKSSDGRLWFATLKGVAVVDPRALRLNTNPPPVIVESVSYADAKGSQHQIDGPFLDQLNLPPGAYDVRVRVGVLSFSAPEKVRCAYQFEGQNGEWADLGTRRVLSFPRLNSGRLVLRIKGSNNDGVWNSAGATIALNLQPFYWETLWFRLASGTGLTGLIGFTAWRGVRRKVERAEHARALVEERARLGVVTEATTDLVCFIDSDGSVSYLNAAGARLLGCARPDAIVGRKFDALFPPAVASRLRRDALPAARGQGSWNGEAVMVSRDAREVTVSLVIVAHAFQAGNLGEFSVIARDISESKEAESALRNSENRFAAAFHANPAILAISSYPDGRYLDVNAQFTAVLGYSHEEVLGRTALELGVWVLPAQRAGIIAALDRGEPVRNVECELRAKSGGVHTVLASVERLELNGRPCLLFINLDITARKHAEVAVALSESRLRAVMESVNEGLIVTDLEDRVLEVNPRMTQMTGFSREEFLGRPAYELLNPEESHAMLDRSARRQSGQSESYEMTMHRKDGTSFWVEVKASPLRNAAGAIVGTVGANTDITQRKLSERSLEQNRLRLQGIISSAMDGIITIGEDMRIVVFNPAAERMFRWPAADAIGQSIEILIPEAHRGAHAGHIRAFGASGVTTRPMGRSAPAKGVRIGGEEFPIEAAISQIEIEGRKLFTVTCRDVTERVRAEEKRQLLEAQLRQAQKMEAIGTLAGGIAHDFNNVLGAIMAYTTLAAEDVADRAAVLDHLDQITQGSLRARDLVKQILTFSRQGNPERRPARLQPAIREAMTLMRATIPTTIAIETRIAEDVPAVLADTTQIHQVLVNLCTNAAHAMREGPGRLLVAYSPAALTARTIMECGTFGPGKYARLTVADTGHGIDPEILKRIFDPFFTTRGTGEGTGLGLSVVHGIVRAHEGNIKVESRLGAGTTFEILLPVVHSQAIDEQPVKPAVPRGSGEHILVVDDEKDLLKTAKRALEHLGYKVTLSADPRSALEIFRENPFLFDAVSTDLSMPGMTGTQLAQELLRVRPDLPILLSTGFAGALSIESVHAMGIRDLLVKPVTLAALGAAIHALLHPPAQTG